MSDLPVSPSAKDPRSDAQRRAEARIAQLQQAEARRASVDLPGKVVLSFVLVAIGIAVAWARTFAEMWTDWFPAWTNPHYAGELYKRLTEGESYYSHGPLVPVTSLVICWMIYKRVGLPIDRTRSSTLLGALMLTCFAAMHLVSVFAGVAFASGFSLIGVLLGLVLLYGGRPLLRAYWLPILILVFMVPLPEIAISRLNFALKSFAAEVSIVLTNSVFGIPAVLSGSEVILPPGADGEPKKLIVENVCGGLRSLISLTFFASLFALVCRVKGFWRLVLLLMAVPVALLSNIIRITSLNVVGHYYTTHAAGEDGWFHGVSGIAVFALALAIMFGLEAIIIAASRLLKRNWVDERLMGFLDKLPTARQVWPASVYPGILAGMAVIAGLSVYWGMGVMQSPMTDVASSAVGNELVIDGHEMLSTDGVLPQAELDILRTNDYLNRQFYHPQVGRIFVLIVFSEDNRKGIHPPDVCLEGSGHRILSFATRPVEALVSDQTVLAEADRNLTAGDLGDVGFRELLTDRSGSRNLFLYTYKCGPAYTPSFFWQQARIVWNGMSSGNASGALIRFSVPDVGHDEESVQLARELAGQVIAQILPQIDKGLP